MLGIMRMMRMMPSMLHSSVLIKMIMLRRKLIMNTLSVIMLIVSAYSVWLCLCPTVC